MVGINGNNIEKIASIRPVDNESTHDLFMVQYESKKVEANLHIRVVVAGLLPTYDYSLRINVIDNSNNTVNSDVVSITPNDPKPEPYNSLKGVFSMIGITVNLKSFTAQPAADDDLFNTYRIEAKLMNKDGIIRDSATTYQYAAFQ